MKAMITILLLSCLSFSCQAQDSSNTIPPKEFKKMLENLEEVQLIDVRTLKEYDDGRIEGATLIDFYQKSFSEEMGKLDKEKPIAATEYQHHPAPSLTKVWPH